MKTCKFAFLLMLCTLTGMQAQQQDDPSTTKNTDMMKTYVIERIIPGAGDLTAEQLKGISQASCAVLEEMGPSIEWQQSFVTGDKVYCVYKAENKALIEEHAKKGGFPANSVSEVASVISPVTAKE